jgi:PPOX class probable F420-dependent enzyme
VVARTRAVDDTKLGRIRERVAQQGLQGLHRCETTCVPTPPVPPEIDTFLREPNPAVVATIGPDGSPHTAATWYDWEPGRALLNMDASRVRLGHLRRDARVSLTVLGPGDDWYRHVTVTGPVGSLEDDHELRDIDRLARRYTGRPFRSRGAKRISAWVDVQAWHAWPPLA